MGYRSLSLRAAKTMPQVRVRLLVLFWILSSAVWFDMDITAKPGICVCAARLNPDGGRIGKRHHKELDPKSKEIELFSTERKEGATLWHTLTNREDSDQVEGPFQRIQNVRRRKADKKKQSRKSRRRVRYK